MGSGAARAQCWQHLSTRGPSLSQPPTRHHVWEQITTGTSHAFGLVCY